MTEEVGVVLPRETRPAGARGPTQRVGSPCVQPRATGTRTRARALTRSLPTPVELSPSISVCLIDCFPASRWTGTSLQNTSHSRFLPRRLPLPTLTHLLHGGESLPLSPPLPSLHPLHFSAPTSSLYFVVIQFSFSLEILWNLLEYNKNRMEIQELPLNTNKTTTSVR